MNAAEQQLVEDRALRDDARAVFDSRLGRVRLALSSRSVGQRLGEDALGRARTAGSEAAAIARDQRWIVAAVALALAGWLLRRPLMRWGKAAWDNAQEPASRWLRLREWIEQKVKS